MVEEATIIPTPDPSWRRALLLCPECDAQLSIDATTKCSDCGAHVQLLVEVTVPGGDSA